MNRVIDKIKSSLNKDVTAFLTKHKIPLVSILVLVLLTCIGFFVSYAFYQSVDITPIIGGTTGKIADLDVRVMAEERDTNGNGLGSYALYPYIPKAGYQYNSAKSYCVNKSTINYDATKYEANIIASGHDVCYLYFDSTASLDLTLNVYAEDIDSNGEGTGHYTKLETTALPSVGYEFNASKSKCEGGSTISYSADINMFTIESTKKDVCNAYMDAMDVDIQLKIYVQAKKNSTEYYEAKSIPNDGFYDLNSSKSSCTGTSTLSMKNQKVVISATSKTSCVAYLDISSGPILESMSSSVSGQNVTLTLAKSNLGTVARNYYYSSDGGKTYTSSTSNTKTYNNLSPLTNYTFKAYYDDASGKTSAIYTVNAKTDYVYNGLFSYSSSVQTKTIEVTGYYKLQVWGAQGGTYNSSYATGGKGGYSVGTVHLNKGDTIYVMTGGQGSYGTSTTLTTKTGGGVNGGGSASYHGGGGGGGTDIRINNNSLYARVIVAGGGGGAHYASSTYKANGGAAGGTTGSAGGYYSSSYSAAIGQGGTATSGGAGGSISTTSGYPGTAGSFGYGGAAGRAYSTSYPGNGGGGGGWYGGGGAGGYSSSSNMRSAGGGGGSGYVYTYNTYSNYPSGCLLNSSYWLSSAQTYSGSSSFESTGGGTETGHTGNGYAKVTYIGQTL